ncbi:MAG: hypothetical protein LBH00_01540 [Planctomycetaceae bacterium]|jgi:Leucine-rich repeat (LRR) protein|nr:hypothetical protein [Planctomycetaceae bacterium]
MTNQAKVPKKAAISRRRMLLIAGIGILIALLIGLPVWYSRNKPIVHQVELPSSSAADHTGIVRTIEAALGTVMKDKNGTITGVNLANERGSVSDEVLKQALELPNLKILRIAGGTITSATFRKIAGQKQLEELFLKETPVQDSDLAVILPALRQLQRLTLRNCGNVTDAGMAAVAAHPKIRVLAAIGLNLTGKGLAEIAKSHRITALDLRQCSALKAEDYVLLEKMPKLDTLKMAGFAVNDAVLQSAVKLPLKNLMIEDSMISAAGFAEISENKRWAEQIVRLELGRNSTLSDAAFAPLKKFTGLKHLSIYGITATGEFLVTLSQEESSRPKLESLSLADLFLTAENAAALKKFKELKTLDLSGNPFEPALVDIITSLESLETLNISGCGASEEDISRLRKMKTMKNLITGQ